MQMLKIHKRGYFSRRCIRCTARVTDGALFGTMQLEYECSGRDAPQLSNTFWEIVKMTLFSKQRAGWGEKSLIRDLL